MTTVVSIASAKGGVSKTTLAVALAAELALDGHVVAVLDCDLNQHASQFGRKCRIDTLRVVPDIMEDTILPQLRAVRGEVDIVLLDLPGVTSRLNMMALQKSNFVLIPCQPSLLDVRDAIRTEQQVADAAELAEREIARAFLWTRVPAAFESRAARECRRKLEERDVPIFRSALMERTAFREMFLTGLVPRQADPPNKPSAAAENVHAIAEELLSHLDALAHAREVAP
jgi:chromosome partitioning protein